MNECIERAIAHSGSQAKLAKSLNVTPVFVNQMLHGIKKIPARLCIPIEQICDGSVTRYELRPDVFGSYQENHAA